MLVIDVLVVVLVFVFVCEVFDFVLFLVLVVFVVLIFLDFDLEKIFFLYIDYCGIFVFIVNKMINVFFNICFVFN